MLSIGGRNPATYPPTLALADPFTQGLGVLDLNSLEWLDAYDPDSGPYTSPDVVRSWYSEKYGSQDLSLKNRTDKFVVGDSPRRGIAPRSNSFSREKPQPITHIPELS